MGHYRGDDSVLCFYVAHAPAHTEECAHQGDCSEEPHVSAEQSEVEEQIWDIRHVRPVVSGLDGLKLE